MNYALWTAILLFLLLICLKIVNQYERGVRFSFGKYAGIMNPGPRLIIPIFQGWERVDMRTNVVDVPSQDCITKDNVTVRVNAVLYFKVRSAEKAFIQVQDYFYAVSQLAQTTMRNVVGSVELDELLANRDDVSKRIEEIVDKASDPWGIEVESVDVKDVELPEQLKRTIAKQAESERERRALIINAEGEKLASKNIMEAAKLLASSKGAMHIRTLKDLNDISSDPTNTIIFTVPIETIGALEGLEKR